MTKDQMRIAGFACLALTAVLLFVAWERHTSHANAVETANRMMNSTGMGQLTRVLMQQMTGQANLEPQVPASTTYSVFFSIISGISSVVLLGASAKNKQLKHRQPEIKFGTNPGGGPADS